MYKIGELLFMLKIFSDATHSGSKLCPAVENTMAMTDPNMTPIFRSELSFIHSLSLSIEAQSKLAFQNNHNVIMVHSIKRGGYKVPGTSTVTMLYSVFLLRLSILSRSQPRPMGGL